MKYRAILADPPWRYKMWGGEKLPSRQKTEPYSTMSMAEISELPILDFAADDCVLFCWIVWPSLPDALEIIKGWGFTYKTCGFCWVKGNYLPLFPEDMTARMTLGYWTRANSEVCLLATRGKPKRRDKGVRQVIIDPLREHSRKPDCVHERIERLVDGPYLELFARQRRPNWDVAFSNEADKFKAVEAR